MPEAPRPNPRQSRAGKPPFIQQLKAQGAGQRFWHLACSARHIRGEAGRQERKTTALVTSLSASARSSYSGGVDRTIGSHHMTRRGRVTWRTRFGSVMRGLAVPAVLLCAIGSANAQTSAPVDDGRAAPRETPNTGTTTTEAPKTEAPTAEAPKAETPKAETPAEPQAQGTSSTSDGFKVGGFVFKPGGRIKLDIIRDFDPITSEDSFDPRTIPTDGSEGGNSQLHARETRLFLDIRGPVEGKELKMYIETDFYGSGNVLRLRQAYGSWGGLLAGQTWSTFVDESNFPNTIDFESPMAFPSIRQAQLR